MFSAPPWAGPRSTSLPSAPAGEHEYSSEGSFGSGGRERHQGSPGHSLGEDGLRVLRGLLHGGRGRQPKGTVSQTRLVTLLAQPRPCTCPPTPCTGVAPAARSWPLPSSALLPRPSWLRRPATPPLFWLVAGRCVRLAEVPTGGLAGSGIRCWERPPAAVGSGLWGTGGLPGEAR